MQHLEHSRTAECAFQALSMQDAPSVREVAPNGPSYPSINLTAASAAGDVTLAGQLLAEGAHMETAAPLEAAVRAGHTAVASLLIDHCRVSGYRRPLDVVNVVANVLNWAASGYCSTAGPAVVAMLVRDGHITALRKGALVAQNVIQDELVQSPNSFATDDSFLDAGLAAVAVAQRVAVPPSCFAASSSAKMRRPGAAKLASHELVAEQVHLIARGLDRRGWSIAAHVHFPPRFQEIVHVVRQGLRSPCSVMAIVNEDVLVHMIAWLATRTYWDVF